MTTTTKHLTPEQGAINWQTFFEAVARAGFNGHFGVDVGGAESGVGNLDDAYQYTAQWLEKHLG